VTFTPEHTALLQKRLTKLAIEASCTEGDPLYDAAFAKALLGGGKTKRKDGNASDDVDDAASSSKKPREMPLSTDFLTKPTPQKPKNAKKNQKLQKQKQSVTPKLSTPKNKSTDPLLTESSSAESESGGASDKS
jgi:hypothetical protein